MSGTTVPIEVTSNASGYGPFEPPFDNTYWLICESFLVILTISCVYITACLLKNALAKPTNDQSKVPKFWLKWLPVFTSVMLLLRLCSDQVAAFSGWQNDAMCFITVTVSTVLFTLGLYAVYIFLWIRQSVFYANPIMKQILRPCVTFFSWFSLGFMLLSGFALGALYNVPQATGWIYKATYEGCVEVSEDSPEIIPGVVAASTVCFQVVLLGLFVYPLLSRRTEEFRANKDRGSRNHSSEAIYQTSTLSHSGEHPKEQRPEDNDEVFETPDGPSTSRQYIVNAQVHSVHSSASHTPISPGRGRPTFRSGTDTESGADIARNDNDGLWGHNHTIKRQNAVLETERKPKRKSIFARISGLSPSSIFYGRAKTASVSSEIVASPNTSDSEARSPSRGLREKFQRIRPSRRNKRSSNEHKKGQKLVAMMKKYTLLMFVCVLTDVGAAVIQIMAERLPELVYLVLFDVSLMVNLICVIFTFSEWDAILMPCAANKSPQNVRRPLQRRPTPPSRPASPMTPRIVQLRKENRWQRRGSSRRSSMSGYESAGSSHGHIYRPADEMKALL